MPVTDIAFALPGEGYPGVKGQVGWVNLDEHAHFADKWMHAYTDFIPVCAPFLCHMHLAYLFVTTATGCC